MRCDQCKHWEPCGGNHGNEPIGVGECLKPKPLWDCSMWSDENGDEVPHQLPRGIHRVMKPEYADAKMFVQDGSDYTAHLLTRPDFYCAEFAKKDDEPR